MSDDEMQSIVIKRVVVPMTYIKMDAFDGDVPRKNSKHNGISIKEFKKSGGTVVKRVKK